MYQFIFPQLTFKKPVKKNRHSPMCFLGLMSHVSVCFEEINGCLSVIHLTARLWGYCTLYGICSSSSIMLTAKAALQAFFFFFSKRQQISRTPETSRSQAKSLRFTYSSINVQVDIGDSCIRTSYIPSFLHCCYSSPLTNHYIPLFFISFCLASTNY